MSVGLVIGMFLTAAIPTVSMLFVTATFDKAYRKHRREKRALEEQIDGLHRELDDLETRYCRLKSAVQKHVGYPCNSLGADICVLCSKRILCAEIFDDERAMRDAWNDAPLKICGISEKEIAE